MTTIRDVAERAQVSVGTVSRVMNNHPSVSPAIRRVVLDTIEELQFQPNAIARTLRTSKTRTLGLVMSDLRTALLAGTAIWGVEAIARERGYAVLVADSQFDREVEAQNVKNLLERRIDGLLCAPVQSSRIIHDLVQGSRVPTVVFGWIVANPVLPTAVMNEVAAIGEAVDHLVDLGHRSLGIITPAGPLGTGSSIRKRLIHEALAGHGVEATGEFDRQVESAAACRRAVHQFFSQHRRPSALIVTTPNLIPATLAGIRDMGASIPDDLSLIGFSDSDWAEVLAPPLNVIAIDAQAHLEAAGRLLLGLIDRQPDLPHTVEHQARYVRRASVERPPRLPNSPEPLTVRHAGLNERGPSREA